MVARIPRDHHVTLYPIECSDKRSCRTWLPSMIGTPLELFSDQIIICFLLIETAGQLVENILWHDQRKNWKSISNDLINYLELGMKWIKHGPICVVSVMAFVFNLSLMNEGQRQRIAANFLKRQWKFCSEWCVILLPFSWNAHYLLVVVVSWSIT